MMQFIADFLLGAGAVGAGLYCFILGRRLNRFNDLEKGVGGAVAVLSAQVDDLSKTLNAARSAAADSAQTLTNLTTRAEDMSRRLELQMASLHDIPEQPAKQAPATPEFVSRMSPPTSADEPMFVRKRAAGGL